VTTPLTRRRFIAAAAAFIAAPTALAGRLLEPTPPQTAGPFYPVTLPLDDDNDLTRVAGRQGVAAGTQTELSGRLLDVNGQPIQGTRIEIWQCDAHGRYRHPHDGGDRPRDENFQGHGRTLTDAEGRYRFRTIRPVPYPGRTPHIHFAVFPAGAAAFTTQLYVRGEPRNSSDFLFNRIPADKRHMLLTDFAPMPAAPAELGARFDIVLGGAEGTPPA
jgi:protocatechuate 3,4-dioxygenase beta subunit